MAHKKTMLKILFSFFNIITITRGELKLCSEPVKKIQLCKKGEDYRANAPPKQFKSLGNPDPTILTPILHLQNIPEVNHDEKYIVVYFTIEMHWNHSNIGVNTPEGVT